eukprot:g41394.t1
MDRVDNGHLTKGNLTSNSSLPDEGNVNEVLITTLLGVILTIMCIFGMLGNIYTLVITNRSIKSAGSMYIYIANLALADLLYLLTIPFVVCTYFAKDWYFGEIGCRFLLSLDLLTMHASIFILTAMSVERYRAVTSPLASRATRTIILLYWACFLPFWVWQLAKLYKQEALSLTPLAQMYINFFVTCLTYSNSCINPFLYMLLTKNYKEYMAHHSRTSTERVTFKRGQTDSQGPK